MSPQAQPDPADICETCHRLFDPVTREIVPGWAAARWVTAGPELCRGCKDGLIETLEKGVPLENAHSDPS